MKHICKIRKALAHLIPRAKSGVNNFALVFPKAETIYYYERVCYHALNYDNHEYTIDGGPIAFLSTIRPLKTVLSKDNKVAAITFLDWTFNDSPFASVFYTKNGRNALRGGVVCHTNVDASLLIGGLSLVRELNEEPIKVVIWYELVRLGMDPLYAYVATYMLQSTEGKGFQWKKPPYNGNHLSLPAILSAKYIRSFCKGKVVIKRHIFKENTNFMGIFNLWGHYHEGGAHRFMFSKKGTKIKYDGWGAYQDHRTIIAFPEEGDRITFVREFSHQMQEICNG